MERSESQREKHVFVAEWDEEGVFFYQALSEKPLDPLDYGA